MSCIVVVVVALALSLHQNSFSFRPFPLYFSKQVERQIDQMVRFIRQEAEEKAAEIAVTAEEVKKKKEKKERRRRKHASFFSFFDLLSDLDAYSSSSSFPLPPSKLLQEFNIEKLTLLDAEKARVAREFERRDAAVEVKKKM